MKYSYTDSGDEWLGKVPAHWEIHRVKDVASLRNEKCVVRSEELDYLELEDLDQGTGRAISFRDTMTVASAVMRFRKGDVLFGKLRPYLEKYYLTETDGYCTGEILPIVPYRICGEFLRYFIASPNFIGQCNVLAYGAKMPRVNWHKQIGLFAIPLPPPEEQAAIAAYLDSACANLGRVIAIKEEQLGRLEEMEKDKISELFVGGSKRQHRRHPIHPWLPALPEGWSAAPMKRLLSEKLQYGANEAAEQEITSHPRYIRITDFGNNGELRPETFKSLPPEVAAPYMLAEGDILFARSGATVGKTFLFTEQQMKACYAGYLIRARTAAHIARPEYLYYFTKTKWYERWRDLIFTQATIQNIGADKYQYLPVVLPPNVTDQDSIISKVKQIIAADRGLEARLISQIETLKAYRRSLIHECVTGKKQVYMGIRKNPKQAVA